MNTDIFKPALNINKLDLKVDLQKIVTVLINIIQRF